jgi:hypothetical protein
MDVSPECGRALVAAVLVAFATPAKKPCGTMIQRNPSFTLAQHAPQQTEIAPVAYG